MTAKFLTVLGLCRPSLRRGRRRRDAVDLEASGEFDLARQCVEAPLATWRDVGASNLGCGQFPKVFGELPQLRRIVADEHRR